MHGHPSKLTYILYTFNFVILILDTIFYKINSMRIQPFFCTWVSTLLLNFSIIIAVMPISFNYWYFHICREISQEKTAGSKST